MANRLADQTSPYLLQHAHNPVDWWPWCPEALELARREDRPILLSVGYSACHWCHVMERESFENPAIAAQMNRDFVPIKVDREERPDLDEIYMQSVQAFTGGHGGWPMTVFLTPKGEPFFGGTYFPPVPGRGMPSFPQVMDHAARLWRQQRDQVTELSAELVGQLQQLGRMPSAEGALAQEWLAPLAAAVAEDFDEENAGFGSSPKFPPHGTLAVLLAHHHRSGDAESLRLATATLDAMAKGGLYDILGGGFARYSVDEAWRVPHFEKMLYDNAQLVPLYLDAWRATGSSQYARVARETLEWTLREMTTAEGGFCAAQDADSEGVEGKFFVFTPAQIREVVGFMDGLRACTLLQVTDAGSFEHGSSVLRLERPIEALPPEDQALLGRVLPKLFAARAQRVAPGLDDKVVAAWSGLMVSAMAKGGFALNEPRYTAAAARAAEHMLGVMTVNGRLHRTYRAGKVGPPAFLDDYAALILGLIDLAETTGDERWLHDALRLADTCVALFWDTQEGGFFFSGHDGEPLIARTRSLLGNATPSGNGLAAFAFARLDTLAGRADLGEKANRVLRGVQPLLKRAARALGVEAIAGAWRSGNVIEVGIVGPDREALLAPLRTRYLPFLSMWHGDASPALVPWMRERPARAIATAYVCERGACNLPTRDPATLAEQLSDATKPVTRDPGGLRVHAPELPSEPDRWLNVEKPLQLADLRGQIVVLDFWTFCCINCQHVLPELAAIEARFADDPVVVIGVHSAKFEAERQRENVALAIARHGIAHPVVLDSEHEIWSRYAVKAWPTVAVIDATGRIAWQQSGEADRETLGRVVRRLLDEAKAAGVRASVPIHPLRPQNPDSTLSFPGKVASWPDAAAQAKGAEMFGLGSRLYISDSGHNRVLEASLTTGPDGWPKATVLRSFGDGAPELSDSPARFRDPQGLCRGGDTLYVADTGNHAIRAIELRSGAVTTLAGTGKLGRGRPKDPRKVELRSPWDLACVDDVLFIAMAGTHQLWIYNAERGQLGPIVGSGAEDHIDGALNEAALAQPSGLVLLGRYLFWVDAETSSVRMCDLSRGEVGTVAGQGLFDFGDVDGIGDEVRLQHPLGITGADGVLYIADTYNGKVKAVDLAAGGVVSTLCAGLREPGGLAVAGAFLIVADTGHHRLVAVHRKSGEIRALALN